MYTITKRAHTSADGTDNPEALVGPGRYNPEAPVGPGRYHLEPWLAK